MKIYDKEKFHRLYFLIKKRTLSDKIKLPYKIQTERSVLMFKDYNMNQLISPLDLEVKLQHNDIAFHIHHLIESIPQEAMEPFVS